MPSASAKLEKQTSSEAYDPVKQVLTIVEKKVRNLEKRKGKLDAYRHDSSHGKELNEDQKKAVEKYDQVVEVLDFTKELQKQFNTVIQDCTKAQKKAAKREQLERQQFELQRIKEIILYQDILTSMGGEEIRNDFLNGNNGAVKLTEDELNSLDELYKAICPERDPEKEASAFDEMLGAAADHIQALLDGKNKEMCGTTYKALKEILLKIQSCSYFSKSSTDEPQEDEPSPDLEEKDAEYSESQLTLSSEKVDESQLTQVSSTPQAERPYFPLESSSVYPEKSHPIQEVLSGQDNLDFLQESQIALETPQAATSLGGPSYPNAQFSSASQPLSSTLPLGHGARQQTSDVSMAANPVTNNLALGNSASLQPQVGANLPATSVLPSTTQALDYDPAHPIPSQTYTNQSFSSAIHPMMASVVSQNYVPVATVSHAIPPQRVLPQSMVVQPLPQRSPAASSLPSNANLPLASSVSGLSTASALSQQASNIYSLCLKMNQLNTDNTQAPCVPSPQYDCGDMQESLVKNSNASYVNAAASRDTRQRGVGSAYSRTSNQMGYGSEQEYQSTNNSQGFVNRDSFADNASYSSNLKRGLPRGGSRNNSARGTSNVRGGRGVYRN